MSSGKAHHGAHREQPSHDAVKDIEDETNRPPSLPKADTADVKAHSLPPSSTSSSSPLSILTVKSDSIGIPRPSRLFYSYSAAPLSMEALYALDGLESRPSLQQSSAETATACSSSEPAVSQADAAGSAPSSASFLAPEQAPSMAQKPKRLTKSHVHYLDHNVSFLASPKPSSPRSPSSSESEKTALVVSQDFSSSLYTLRHRRQRANSLPNLYLGKDYIVSGLSKYKSLSLSSLWGDEQRESEGDETAVGLSHPLPLSSLSRSPSSKSFVTKRSRKYSATLFDAFPNAFAASLQRQMNLNESEEASPVSLSNSIHDWIYDGKPCLHEQMHLDQKIHEKFRKLILEKSIIDLASLKSLCWKGMPFCFRPIAWKILMGYLPNNHKEKHDLIVQRKRIEYFQLAKSLGIYPEKKPGFDLALYHQITIDIPRTNPNMPLFKLPFIQQMLERVLYCWSIRFPASGYVQGLNDLLTPLVLVFLTEVLQMPDGLQPEPHFDLIQELLSLPISPDAPCSTAAAYIAIGPYRLAPEDLEIVEANSYFCFLKLLEKVQDRYTIGQTGLVRQIARLEELMLRVDPPLMRHFKSQGLDLYIFAYRWINCLLMRELPLHLIIRLWDTVLSEGDKGFSEFYLHVMAALLRSFSQHLQTLDFQDLVLYLQHLPTDAWTEHEMQLLTSEAYILKELFASQSTPLKLK